MSAARKPAAADKAAAARAETQPAERKIDFRGLELTLPEVLPGTIALDYADLEDGRNELLAIRNLIRSAIGHEQYRAVYDKVAEDGVTLDDVADVLEGLLDSIFEAYGLGPGE